jgi:hypothetical protein
LTYNPLVERYVIIPNSLQREAISKISFRVRGSPPEKIKNLIPLDLSLGSVSIIFWVLKLSTASKSALE